MERRQYLKRIGAAGVIASLAGCGGDSGNGNGNGGNGNGNGGNGNGNGGNGNGNGGNGNGDSGNGNGGSGNGSGGNGNGNGNGDDSEPYVDGKIKFLMSPSEPQDRLLAQYEPIKEQLNSYVDAVDTVELQYANNYAATLTALNAGTGDAAETGPFAAALGVEAGNAEVALQRWGFGGWTYSSVIMTTEGSEIESITDLEGKTVGFADPLSASGSLYPLAMIKEAGLAVPEEPGAPAGADFTPRWSDHFAAIEALQSGTVDAAGVGFFAASGEEQEYREGLQEVARDDGIPRAPIVVSPQLSEGEKETLTNAFLDAPDEMYLGADGEEGTEDDLWFSKVRKADVDTYQPVIEKAQTLGYGTSVFES